MIDYALLERERATLSRQFREAKPFPWLMLDDFLEAGSAARLAAGFEAVMRRGNKNPDAVKKHTHVLRKRGMLHRAMMEPEHRELFDELASERFVRLVSEITGISPLYADPDLMGGGLHEIFPGGYLDIHTDFNVHPKNGLHRRLNILIYLNEGWRPEWKGALELWPADNSACAASILPVAGRMALFETSEISFHGHPAPLACPPGITRKSLAAYYYSDWPAKVKPRTKTNYRLTPEQRLAHPLARATGPLKNAMRPATRPDSATTTTSRVAIPEPVRMVIWDLDETFWSGTLSEGGVRLVDANKDIVITLAKRGIVSSLCSKNNDNEARGILTDHGLWDYFVFPSLSWSAKGPRIRSLIDAMGLRPSSVLYIDDNPTNLEEARHLVPGLQVASHAIIPQLLADPRLKGKDDAALSRLNQYKVLEHRKAEEQAAGGDVAAFLRDSDIRVRLEFDVEPHIDRMVELINRTNQLNFTKARLPEEAAEARTALLALLRSFRHQAALVHVRDRYGDHGFCGVYVHDSEHHRLRHFAFSCRILGMGVERWLYQRLGSPTIAIAGEVLADLGDKTPVDWVTLDTGNSLLLVAPSSEAKVSITARGSCDLAAVVHYFATTTQDAIGEHHVYRGGGAFRLDHSVFLRHAVKGLSDTQIAAARSLGYLPADFETRLFRRTENPHCVLLSFGADVQHALYRHRASGLEVPFTVLVKDRSFQDLRKLPITEIRDLPWAREAFTVLREEFDYLGLSEERSFREHFTLALARLSLETRVFVLKLVEPAGVGAWWAGHTRRVRELNRWIAETAATWPNVSVVDVAALADDRPQLRDFLHQDRMTYYRIYREVRAALET